MKARSYWEAKVTTASFNRIGPGARLSSAFELWKFDSLADPASARTARSAPKAAEQADAQAALREAARAEGHAAGLAAGRAEARHLVDQEVQHLRALLATFGDAINSLQDEVGAAALGLALDVARQVLRSELSTNPDALLAGIREALDLGGSGNAQLMLHPEDAAFVREPLRDLLNAGQWRIVEDASIGRGGCKIVTSSGSIDATMATRWRRVVAALGSNDAW
jgi:flagellar assembly protein FliH